MNSHTPNSTMKQYTISDIKALQERQQAAHRGRGIYSDMRSTSEEQFRNALERDAMPIIGQLLEVVQKQHAALKEVRREGHQIVDDALSLAEPWIETHQSRIRRNDEQRSR
jgi:hypothetical protein